MFSSYCIHTYIRVHRIHIYIYTHTYTYIYTHIHTHIYIYIYVYVYVYVYVNTQASDSISLATPVKARTIDPEPQGGPQSVCLALAAICFSEKAKPLWTKRGLETPGVKLAVVRFRLSLNPQGPMFFSGSYKEIKIRNLEKGGFLRVHGGI